MFTWGMASILLWLTLPVKVLTLTDVSTATILFCQIVTPGDTFKTVYTHSLEHTPVWEYFRIGNHYELVLTDTVYQSTGAGLPFAAYGHEVFTTEDGYFHISAIDRPLPAILLRVNVEYHNTFFFNDIIRLHLSDLVGNTVVKIQTEGKPFFVMSYHVLKRIISSGVKFFCWTNIRKAIIYFIRATQ